jgi:3-deoxy-7-phosphoheptulonate synthase
MLIFVKKDTPEAAIRSLVIQLSRQGIGTARADSAGRTMLTLVGETWTLDEQRLLALPYVAEVKRLTPVWRLASRQTHPEDTVVSVGDAQIGKGFCLMAGPCAVESALQMQGVARGVKAAGGLVLRGGAYKPRTSPYAFQGFGAPALELLAQTGREVGLPTVSEITDAAQLPQFEQVDMLQVGARNMQNYELLRALGQQSKPVLLKRAVGATVEELLQSAEYILAGGNPNVVLCERGVRSFSKTSRAALDVSAIPVLKRMTHLPVIVDPSHAAGEAALVPPLALAAVAAGADGLLIEVHDRPAAALSDAAQSLSCTAFAELAEKIKKVREAIEA